MQGYPNDLRVFWNACYCINDKIYGSIIVSVGIKELNWGYKNFFEITNLKLFQQIIL